MGKHREGKQGQLISSEIVLALSLFLIALAIYLLAWNFILNSYKEQQAERQMQSALVGISDAAVLSPGYPADWEYGALENASSFGLAQSQGVLSPQKLSALQSLNYSFYDRVRERMGAGRHELFIQATSASGVRLYTFGKAADLGNSSISAVSAERLAIMDDSLVTLKVQLWRNKR